VPSYCHRGNATHTRACTSKQWRVTPQERGTTQTTRRNKKGTCIDPPQVQKGVRTMNFDPYYVWLGIPPEEQPPNHYRLLGLRRYENNADVISNAADRQMVYLRQFQAGERSGDAVRLLNVVSAARVCLLSSTDRNVYNQWLRTQPQQTPEMRIPSPIQPPIPPGKSYQDAVKARQLHRKMMSAPPKWENVVDPPPRIDDSGDMPCCRQCATRLTGSETTCPHCGATEPTTHWFLVGLKTADGFTACLMAGAVIWFLCYMLSGS